MRATVFGTKINNSTRLISFYYDDLSYWGLYTKNIFSINKLPHFFENCSVDYKDYTPIMQILQYLALFGRSNFSEGVMFRTNVCFIYIMLLPILTINVSYQRLRRLKLLRWSCM